MSRVVADLDALAELIDRMQRFEAQLARAREYVEVRTRRMDQAWTGSAAAAQGVAHARWDAGAAQVHEALAALRAVASTAHGNYCAAVLANRRMWSL